MEKTLVLVKPDAVQRGLVGEIISRFEKKSIKIVGCKMMKLKEAVLREHYAHVVDESFFEELSQFMSSSPVFVLCLEGIDAVNIVRKLSGTDNFQLGTIRGDFSVSSQKNLIHSSDSITTAKREISRFFSSAELFDYDKTEWKHIYAEVDKHKS
ncbi:nucleoside-diphosphate kinase [Candidatus Gracilibacteria bacterium]|nr:nucleoside-diphosphate kinase [Candidatus Gracilibacteria bacterium]